MDGYKSTNIASDPYGLRAAGTSRLPMSPEVRRDVIGRKLLILTGEKT